MRNLLSIIGVFVFAIIPSAVCAIGMTEHDGQSKTVTVSISEMEPLVIKGSNGRFTGFDVDVVEGIAKVLNWEVAYELVELEDRFWDIENNRADMAVSGIAVTGEREIAMDFTHHYLDAGLGIMIPVGQDAGLLETIKQFFSPRIIKGLLMLLGFIFVFGHVVWYADRGHAAIADDYATGILESFWFILITMSTVGYGDIAPKMVVPSRSSISHHWWYLLFRLVCS